MVVIQSSLTVAQCIGKQMANYIMKMLLILCLRHYDLVPVGGYKTAQLPKDNPRSASTTMPDKDLDVILVKRKK